MSHRTSLPLHPTEWDGDTKKKKGLLAGQYLTKVGKNTYKDVEKGVFKDPKGLVRMKNGHPVDDSFKYKGNKITKIK